MCGAVTPLPPIIAVCPFFRTPTISSPSSALPLPFSLPVFLLTSAPWLFLSWRSCERPSFPYSIISVSILDLPHMAGCPHQPWTSDKKEGSYLKESKVLAAQISVPSMSSELSLLPF